MFDLSLRFTFLLLSRDNLFVPILSQIGDGESPCHPINKMSSQSSSFDVIGLGLYHGIRSDHSNLLTLNEIIMQHSSSLTNLIYR